MAKNYTTKTASLRATSADVRTLDAKKIKVKDTRADSPTAGQQVDIVEMLGTVKSGIDIGKADNAYDTMEDTEGFAPASTKINFKGKYVTVVKKDDGVIDLWFNENNSLPDFSSLSGQPAKNTTVYVYSDATDDFALPVAAGAPTKVTKTVSDGTNFGTVTMTAKSSSNAEVFTSSQDKSIWYRLTYDGTASAWAKIPLNVDYGTYNLSSSAFTGTAHTQATSGFTAISGISHSIYNYTLDDEDAGEGKIPGQTETKFNITLNYDTIATKDGGSIKLDWAIATGEAEPASYKTVDIFLTEYKTPAIASLAAEYKTKKTIAISGLTYNTTGSTATVTTGDITNTQYKSASDLARVNIANNTSGLTISGGGDKSITTTTAGDMTLKSGTVTASDAVYTWSGDVTLQGGGAGDISLKATPKGYGSGTAATSNNLTHYWGTTTGSSDTLETWGEETYRKTTPETVDTDGDWDGTVDISTLSYVINGTTTVPAVCQYGKLVHPSKAVADANGKSYSNVTTPASFVRKFTGDVAKPNSFTLTASNLIQSGKVTVYWYDAATSAWYNLSTAVAGSVAHSSTNTITKTIKTADGETSTNEIIIAIIMQSTAAAIDDLSISFA